MSNSIITGLIVTITDDMGPKPVINLSHLDEIVSHKLAMIGMTVLMLGNSDPEYFAKRHFKLLGPLPIPIDIQITKTVEELETVAIIFNVKVDLPTQDPRAKEFGRETIVWFVFKTADRDKIYTKTKFIEEITSTDLKKLKFESELTNQKFFSDLLLKVQQSIEDKAIETDNVDKYVPTAIKYSNYSCYKFDPVGEKLVPILSLAEIDSLDVLVLADLLEKKINILHLKNITERNSFLIGRAVTNLNFQLKREFTIKKVSDQIEIMFLLKKLKT